MFSWMIRRCLRVRFIMTKTTRKRNLALFMLFALLCLLASLVQMRGRHGTFLELITTSSPSNAIRYAFKSKPRPPIASFNATYLSEYMVDNENWTEPVGQKQKYLIYLCDGHVRCFGLADRERGMVFSYLMSLLTNRKFGIHMTYPAPLEDYYVPNLIDWTISPDELTGKTAVEVSLLGRRQTVGESTIDFNAVFPQDVVYFRTNSDIGKANLSRNAHFKYKFNYWNLKLFRKLFAHLWIALMKPTTTLRRQLNTVLAEIAHTMTQEVLLLSRLKKVPCLHTCELLKTDNNVWDMPEFNTLHKQAFQCIQSLQKDIRNAPYTIFNGAHQETLISILNFKTEDEETSQEEGGEDSITTLQDLCKLKSAIRPNVTIEDIWASQGYDYMDLKLVCVHIRLGNSPTMPWEKGVRNTLEDTNGVWEFLKPYVDAGHHVFLASDAEQVRVKGKAMFGSRLHINKDPVIHIDKVKDWQDERKGLELALTEQLFLMTSCDTLVVSNSGFSQRAAMIRRQLFGIGNVYLFRHADVTPWAIHF